MSSFVNLIAKDVSATIHTRNLQVLATEMFKVQKYMLTELMQGLFRVRQPHDNLGNPQSFSYFK